MQYINQRYITIDNNIKTSYIIFNNNVQYTFLEENRGVYRNKIKIARNVSDCEFLVNNEKIADNEVKDLASNIAKQIETDLKYPGRIRLTMIRETRIVEYAR